MKEIATSTAPLSNVASSAGRDERIARPNMFALKRWPLAAAVMLLIVCVAATRILWVRSKAVGAANVPIASLKTPTTAQVQAPLAQSLPTSSNGLSIVTDIAGAPAVRENQNAFNRYTRQRRKDESRTIAKVTRAVNGNREPRVFHLPVVHNSALSDSRINAEFLDTPDIPIGPPVAPKLLLSGVALARPTMQARPIWGRLIWTGDLQRNGFIVFSASGSSRGVLNGRLPGIPIKIKVQPGEVIEGGIAILTNDVNRVGINEPPYARNGWDLVIHKWVPKPVPELKVAEAPSPSNNWSRMVLQNGDRNLSVVIVDWEASGATKPGN